MSETSRPASARRLTASVVPGRGTANYSDLVAARLRRIATERRTGQLPFAGSSGAIYVQNGKVVYAESRLTPGPAAMTGFVSAAVAIRNGLAPGNPLPAARSVAAIMAVTEPTVDAVLDLMSRETRPSRFRSAKVSLAGLTPGIGVAALLAEVARRRRLLAQMGPVLTADTAIGRNPHPRRPAIRVSALQWALLIRVRDGSTPRDLAWDLGRSVFGTTAEIYRLMILRLVTADRGPSRAARPDEAPRRCPAALSFIRAVSVEKGDTMLLRTSGTGSGKDR
jgi:hypothetical protein